MALPTGGELEEAALEYGSWGFRVFPLQAASKAPRVKAWPQRATSDPEAIRRWWSQHPDANIGVRCGQGLFVLDADSPEGEAVVGELGLPDTTVVRTRNGRHWYLRGTAPTRTKIRPGLDVRGEGGYVVGAGSVHPTGDRYRWLVPPWQCEPAPVPSTVSDLLEPVELGRPRGRPGSGGVSERIYEGARNGTLIRLAGRLKRDGLADGAIRAALLEHNRECCIPPLPPAEIELIARSAARWERPPLWLTDPAGFVAGLRPTDRSVLLTLCGHANAEGACWPGMRRLAALSGVHRSSVPAIIDRLVALGRIAATRSRAGNRYRILDSPIHPPTGSSVRVRRTDEPSTPPLGARDDPEPFHARSH